MRRPFARAQLKGRIAGLVGPKANLVGPKVSFVGSKVTWFSENADYCSHSGEDRSRENLVLTTNRSTGERHKIMSGRTLVLLSASALVGIACVVTVATDAFAQRRGGAAVARGGVHHGGVARAGVYRGVGYRGAPVARAAAWGVGAAAVGAAATGYGLYGPYGYGQFSGARANYFGAPYSGWSDYASRNGLVCQPGTLWTGPDGLPHMCQ